MQLPWGAYVIGRLGTYLAMFYCCQLAAICGLNFSLASTQNIESRQLGLSWVIIFSFLELWNLLPNTSDAQVHMYVHTYVPTVLHIFSINNFEHSVGGRGAHTYISTYIYSPYIIAKIIYWPLYSCVSIATQCVWAKSVWHLFTCLSVVWPVSLENSLFAKQFP